jgi:hypothetical protein
MKTYHLPVYLRPALPLPPGEADFVSETQSSLRNPVRDRSATGPSPNPLPEGEGLP